MVQKVPVGSADLADIVLKDFLARIAAVRAQISRIVLFGSRARGTHAFESDYDVLLAVKQKDDAMLDVLYEAVMDVLLLHGRLISLKIYPEEELARLKALQTPFIQQVEKEGVPLG